MNYLKRFGAAIVVVAAASATLSVLTTLVNMDISPPAPRAQTEDGYGPRPTPEQTSVGGRIIPPMFAAVNKTLVISTGEIKSATGLSEEDCASAAAAIESVPIPDDVKLSFHAACF